MAGGNHPLDLWGVFGRIAPHYPDLHIPGRYTVNNAKKTTFEAHWRMIMITPDSLERDPCDRWFNLPACGVYTYGKLNKRHTNPIESIFL